MDLPGLENLLKSFTVAIRGQIKAEKTVKRIDEVIHVYEGMGMDVPTAELKVALNKEEK